jgi:flagella basal body P-ring formation protein FlgA
MRRLLPLLALAAASLAAVGPVQAEQPRKVTVGQPVSLNTEIVVEGDTVTLDHLFAGLGQRGATPIARAPEPGKEVRLPARWLGRVARAYDIAWEPLSDLQSATLRRAAQRIEGKQIARAIRAQLSRRGVDGALTVDLDTPDMALVLPVDVPGEVQVAGVNYDRPSGRFTASLVAPSAQRPLARASVSGRAVAMVDVPVLTRRIGRDELISDGDIAWVRRPADDLQRNVLLDPADLAGMSARRAIRADRPVRATDVRAPRLVARNALVTLMLETDRMRLTAQGRALQDGAKGEVVRVLNTKSNTTVAGVVVADGTVAVQAGSRPISEE